jgi:hypothetical protein
MDELLVGANLVSVKLLRKRAVPETRAILPQPILPDFPVAHVKQDRPVVGRFGALDIAHIETHPGRRGFISGKGDRRRRSQHQQAQGDKNGFHGGTLLVVLYTRAFRKTSVFGTHSERRWPPQFHSAPTESSRRFADDSVKMSDSLQSVARTGFARELKSSPLEHF